MTAETILRLLLLLYAAAAVFLAGSATLGLIERRRHRG